MAKQRSFPDIREVDGGYTTPTRSLTVGDLKIILEKFPDEMGVGIAMPSEKFTAMRHSGASWVGKTMCPMSGAESVCIQPLSPSSVEENRIFIEEQDRKKEEKEKLIWKLFQKFAGENIAAHLQKSFLGEMDRLSVEHLNILLNISVPIADDMRDLIKNVPPRAVRILEICASVKDAEEKGLYEISESLTPDI